MTLHATTIHQLADALSTVQPRDRIAYGNNLILAAAADAASANAHNAGKVWPDGTTIPPHTWEQHLQSVCLRAKADYARLNPGKFAVALGNRDGLNALEAAVIVLDAVLARAEDVECAA